MKTDISVFLSRNTKVSYEEESTIYFNPLNYNFKYRLNSLQMIVMMYVIKLTYNFYNFLTTIFLHILYEKDTEQ